MEGYLVPVKRRLHLIEEFAINQHQSSKRKARPKKQRRHWLCNELIHEFCCAISALKTSDRILLSASNIHTYLEAQFRKKLIYRNAIAFFKKNTTKWWQRIEIEIDQSKRFAKSYGELDFQGQNNQFRVQMEAVKGHYSVEWFDHDQFESAQMHYFLRLVAPFIQPIELDLNFACYYPLKMPIEELVRLLNVQSIASVKLRNVHFNSTPICEALANCNKLHICGPLMHTNVPKFVHWLTANTNGQPKKSIIKGLYHSDEKTTLLIDAIKMDFLRATSKRRFVVRLLEVGKQLVEFALRNEINGEMLALRCTNVKDGQFFYALSPIPVAELDNTNNGNLCAAEADDEGHFGSRIIWK